MSFSVSGGVAEPLVGDLFWAERALFVSSRTLSRHFRHN